MSRRRSLYRNRSRIRKESRSIPLRGNAERGNGLDDGRYFRCWNCGFVCNVDRDALGGPESRDGLYYEDFPIPVYGADTAVKNSGIARLGGSIGNQTLVAVIQEGTFPGYMQYPGYTPAEESYPGGHAGTTPNTDNKRYHIKPVVGQGCPFCGSLNWKGDYP